VKSHQQKSHQHQRRDEGERGPTGGDGFIEDVLTLEGGDNDETVKNSNDGDDGATTVEITPMELTIEATRRGKTTTRRCRSTGSTGLRATGAGRPSCPSLPAQRRRERGRGPGVGRLPGSSGAFLALKAVTCHSPRHPSSLGDDLSYRYARRRAYVIRGQVGELPDRSRSA
jgi:hypothetical protein